MIRANIEQCHRLNKKMSKIDFLFAKLYKQNDQIQTIKKQFLLYRDKQNSTIEVGSQKYLPQYFETCEVDRLNGHESKKKGIAKNVFHDSDANNFINVERPSLNVQRSNNAFFLKRYSSKTAEQNQGTHSRKQNSTANKQYTDRIEQMNQRIKTNQAKKAALDIRFEPFQNLRVKTVESIQNSSVDSKV